MDPFSNTGYQYNCALPLFYISLINLSLSITSLFLPEFQMVKTSSKIEDPHLCEILGNFFSGVTALISITTILGTVYSCRKAILLLLVWDSYRFLFVVWAATGPQSATDLVFYFFLAAWLVLCFIAEMSHLTQPKMPQFIPELTIAAIFEDCPIYNSQARSDGPPSYEDIAPPPYSPRGSSSNSVRPTSTVFTITEGSSYDIPPPSYESLGFDKHPRF